MRRKLIALKNNEKNMRVYARRSGLVKTSLVYGKLGHFLLLVSWYLETLTVIAVYTPFACYSTKVFFLLFSVRDNILYNPALLLQRLLQRIQTETLLRLMQQDKSTSSCLVSTLGYPRRKNTVTSKSCGNCNDSLRF